MEGRSTEYQRMLEKHVKFPAITRGSRPLSCVSVFFQGQSLKIFSTYIRKQEVKTKEYIDNLFAYETAYINTNHDDFIGFTQAAANTTTEIKKNPNQQPKNMVIRKGWLNLNNLGMMRGIIIFYDFFLISSKRWFERILVRIDRRVSFLVQR